MAKNLFGKSLIPSHMPFLRILHLICLMIGHNFSPCLKHLFPSFPRGKLPFLTSCGSGNWDSGFHQDVPPDAGVGTWPEMANHVLSRICFLDGDVERQNGLEITYPRAALEK